MDVLIKGMELPEEGKDKVITIMSDGSIWDGEFVMKKFHGKAIELPPHGRLIDADKMELDFRAAVANLIEKYPDLKNTFSEYERLVIGILNRTPTVMEATK